MPILRTVRVRSTLSIVAASVFVSTAGAAGRVATERVSVASGGTQFVGASFDATVSANGRFVAFETVEGQFTLVVVRDRKNDFATIASGTSDGSSIDGSCSQACISASGRFVAFQSDATHLVGSSVVLEDTNGVRDVFVRDMKTGTTRRVSIATDGTEGNNESALVMGGLSANGRFVVFRSSATNLVSGDTNQASDIFVHDLRTGKTALVSVGFAGEPADRGSSGATVSANGRFVAFESSATNLVPGDGNAQIDVFVRDRRAARTFRASVNSSGAESIGSEPGGASISSNGKAVAFRSDATTLVDGDTNGLNDVFVHDLRSGRTVRVSVATDGAEATSGRSGSPSVSSDGRTVFFMSSATNLVSGDTNQADDVFAHDVKTGVTRRISVGAQGEEGNGASNTSGGALSSNGKFVVFNSYATNFTSGDTNGQIDVFLVSTK